MNAHTEQRLLDGPVGRIELAIDRPDPASTAACRGTAIISHPHPLFGGTLHNKVVQTLARAFVQTGWTVVRHNFRGVGLSQGEHDNGRGELDDLLAVIAAEADSAAPLALAGFSFGAFVTSHAVARLHGQRALDRLVLIGTAASRFAVAPIDAELHSRTLVVHGEADDTVPLAAVMDWARPQSLPVTVVPGGGHFFHGQLPLLRDLVARHVRA